MSRTQPLVTPSKEGYRERRAAPPTASRMATSRPSLSKGRQYSVLSAQAFVTLESLTADVERRAEIGASRKSAHRDHDASTRVEGLRF